MFRDIFIFALLLNVAFCAPQFITLKDGKIGVNFGGYHAEAGLGGFLTGNAAHGGLSASAGTPFGQRAAAGLGGQVGERSFGGAYAGASAGGGVGASAGLGGVLNGEYTNGGLGAEAHVGGNSRSVYRNGGGGVVKQTTTIVEPQFEYEVAGEVATGAAAASNVVTKETTVVQRIKPPKKYVAEAAPSSALVVENVASPGIAGGFAVQAAIEPRFDVIQSVSAPAPVQFVPVTQTKLTTVETQVVPAARAAATVYSAPSVYIRHKHIRPRHRHRARKQFIPVVYQPQPVAVVEKRKQVFVAPPPVYAAPPAPAYAGGSGGVAVQGGVQAGTFFDNIFQIPIATLQAVNNLLNSGAKVSGAVAVEKSVNVQG